MSVAVQRTLEAWVAFARGNRCPGGWMVDIGTQEELEVLASFDTIVQQAVAFQCTRRSRCQQTQVVQVLEQVETILRAAAVVVDVNLRIDLYLMVVDIVVVSLVVHHLLQVVVVGHAHWYVVREGLAQIRLGVVGQIVLVLVEIERGS